MSRATKPEKQPMSPIQKQAVLVCVICALAILITASVTSVMLTRSEETPSSEPTSQVVEDDLAGHYQIDTTSAAILTETADAGESYLMDTLFLGDSNTVRCYNNGLIGLQQFCAKEGIGIQGALSESFVTFKRDDNQYTIAQSVAMMKPRRVVITLGTNDNGMEVETFISYYTQLVQAIQTSYPYTDIIVNTIPPIPEDHSKYPAMEQKKIDNFNMALLTMCEQLGIKFLNSTEVLKDPATGYGKSDYYISGDIHLKSSGLKAMLNYVTTHAYETEDRRPDTSNIPTRTIEYTSNPSSAVPNPEPEVTAETYEARYQIDKNVGGTLSSGSDTDQTSLLYTVTEDQSVTVTAVPANGYVFVKWSDGLTSRTRTDSGFKQNLDVTAVFASASVTISGEGSAILGMRYTFKASLSGAYTSAENLHWYVNGEENKDVAGMTTVSFIVDPILANQEYSIYAVVTYNDCQVVSNTLKVSFSGGVSSGSSSSDSSSSSSGSDDSSSSSSSTSSSASSSSKPSSGSANSKNEEDLQVSASSSSSSHSSHSSSSASSSKPTSSSESNSSSASKPSDSASSSKPSSSSSSDSASSSSESSTSSSSKPSSSTSSSKPSSDESDSESKPSSSTSSSKTSSDESDSTSSSSKSSKSTSSSNAGASSSETEEKNRSESSESAEQTN